MDPADEDMSFRDPAWPMVAVLAVVFGGGGAAWRWPALRIPLLVIAGLWLGAAACGLAVAAVAERRSRR